MKFVIIGNGVAGISAARAIRRISGDASITIVSDEAVPAYSACVLPNYLGGEIRRDEVIIKHFSEYSEEGINLLPSQKVTGIEVEGKRVIHESGSLAYDKLIIAAGSRPVIPSSVHAEKDGVFTFKSLGDADRIARWQGRSAVVVGSGPIGLEAGMALKRRGYRVVVVELLGHILPKVFDAHSARLVRQILQEHGIEVLEGEKLVDVLGTRAVFGVMTDKRTIECDTVVLAMGMKPRGISLLNAEIGGNGGIAVNDKMETSLEDIFACGDCVDAKDLITGRMVSSMLWHNARRQGEVAGCNAAGMPAQYNGSLNVAGLNLFGIQAISIGMGGNEQPGDTEVIEREREGGYQRVILLRSVVVGMQSINWPENVGCLLTSIVRKDKAPDLRDAPARRRPPLRVRPFAHTTG